MTFPANSSNSAPLTPGEDDFQESWADIWALEDPAISGASPSEENDDGLDSSQ